MVLLIPEYAPGYSKYRNVWYIIRDLDYLQYIIGDPTIIFAPRSSRNGLPEPSRAAGWRIASRNSSYSLRTLCGGTWPHCR